MDNNTNKKPSKTNMPKFNLNWLYMIIAMMLLGLYLTCLLYTSDAADEL